VTITPFAGSSFWLITLGFVAFQNFLRSVSQELWLKNTVMTAVSAFVVFWAMNGQAALMLVLAILCVLVYFTGEYLAAADPPGSAKAKWIIGGAIVLIVTCLSYFKYGMVQSILKGAVGAAPTGHVFLIGVSYFSFKFIHFLVECHQKKIEAPDFLTFLNYTFFFPAFFSGPINRYNAFAVNVSAMHAQWRKDAVVGGKRIINGLFKKIVLGDTLYRYSIAALDPAELSGLQIAGATYIYMLHVYFNFSGYTDMAIGCGRLVGIELPENFNYPFFKRNIQKFWANWHMSLTTWLTDYIYWPLAKKFRNVASLRKRPVTISNISIIATFLVCGVWHGDGLNYIIWGAYHGLGLATLNGYTYLIKKYSNQAVKKFVNTSPVAYGISLFITIQFVAFGFLLFACDLEKLKVVFDAVTR